MAERHLAKAKDQIWYYGKAMQYDERRYEEKNLREGAAKRGQKTVGLRDV